MKLLVLLFLVGCAAAASIYEHDAAEEHPLFQEADEEGKNEIAERLKETLKEIMNKMKDSLEKGKMFKEDLLEKFDDTIAKLKNLKVDFHGKLQELGEKVRDKFKNFVKDLLEKWKEERSVDVEHVDFNNLKEMFKKLKDSILAKIDKEKLKAKVEEIFGKGSEMADSILDLINKKGDKYKQKLLDLVDRYLGKDEVESKRSVSEVWEKIKEYFKNLHIDLKEKYMKFGEWVKEMYDKGLEKGKSKMENIRNIAKEFVEHTKGVSKEVAVEALEFLRPYKKDLGALWDQVKVAVKDIVQRKE